MGATMSGHWRIVGAVRKFVSKPPPSGLHLLSATVNANHKFNLTEGSGYYHLLNASPPWPIQKDPCPSIMKSICLKRMRTEGIKLDLRLLSGQPPCFYPEPARLGQRIKARCWEQVWVGLLRSCLECLFRKTKLKLWPAPYLAFLNLRPLDNLGIMDSRLEKRVRPRAWATHQCLRNKWGMVCNSQPRV